MVLAAQNAFTNGQYADSVAICRNVLSRQPTNLVATLMMGISLSMSGNASTGEVYLQNALKQHPNSSEALLTYGNYLASTDRPLEGLPYVEKAAQIAAEDPDCLNTLGVLYAECNRHEDARKIYLEMVAKWPTEPAFLHNLALASKSVGDVDAAVSSWQKMTVIAPESFGPHFEIGVVQKERGHFKEAIEAFTAGLSIAPNIKSVLEMLAECYEAIGDTAAAAKTREQLLLTSEAGY